MEINLKGKETLKRQKGLEILNIRGFYECIVEN
jgi:hypothetical protein